MSLLAKVSLVITLIVSVFYPSIGQFIPHNQHPFSIIEDQSSEQFQNLNHLWNSPNEIFSIEELTIPAQSKPHYLTSNFHSNQLPPLKLPPQPPKLPPVSLSAAPLFVADNSNKNKVIVTSKHKKKNKVKSKPEPSEDSESGDNNSDLAEGDKESVEKFVEHEEESKVRPVKRYGITRRFFGLFKRRKKPKGFPPVRHVHDYIHHSHLHHHHHHHHHHYHHYPPKGKGIRGWLSRVTRRFTSGSDVNQEIIRQTSDKNRSKNPEDRKRASSKRRVYHHHHHHPPPSSEKKKHPIWRDDECYNCDERPRKSVIIKSRTLQQNRKTKPPDEKRRYHYYKPKMGIKTWDSGHSLRIKLN